MVKIVSMKCVVCDKEIEKSKFTNKVLCSDECFSTDFWNELVLIKDRPNTVRVDGQHYIFHKDLPNDDRYSFRGYGGAKFFFRFFDKRVVETTNLWHQGTIRPPPHIIEKTNHQNTILEKTQYK